MLTNIYNFVYLAGTGGLTRGLAGTSDISKITQYFDHGKSSSILQLIKGKSRDLEILHKYFNGTKISASNLLLLSDVFTIIFSHT